jgi:hypothetical protein
VLGARGLLRAGGLTLSGVELAAEVLVGVAAYAGAALVLARPVVDDAWFLLRDTWARRRAAAA